MPTAGDAIQAMLVKFAIADRATGAWHEFEREVPQAILDQSYRERAAMTYLREALSDGRISGRTMIWEPA